MKTGRKSARWLMSLLLLALAASLAACQAAAPSPTQAPAAKAAATTQAPAATTAAPGAPAATTASAPAATSAAAASEVLRVGVSVPLTGAGAPTGIFANRVIQFAIDDINAKGGINVGGKTYRIEPIIVDDKANAETGREVTDRLVLAEKVRFIVGTNSTPLAGAQPISEAGKVLQLANVATEAQLGPKFPYTLNAGLSLATLREAALYENLLKQYPNAKRVAILMPDNASGRATADGSEKIAIERGFTVASKEFFPVDLKDASALVTRILATKPDAIDTQAGNNAPQFLAIMQALTEQGFTGPVQATTIEKSAFQRAGEWKSPVIVANISDVKSEVLTQGERDLFQRVADKYGADAVQPNPWSYNEPLLLKQGIEKAGTVDDALKVADALRAGEWDTIWSSKYGKSRFTGVKTLGAPATISQPIYLSKAEGGKLTTAAAIQITTP